MPQKHYLRAEIIQYKQSKDTYVFMTGSAEELYNGILNNQVYEFAGFYQSDNFYTAAYLGKNISEYQMTLEGVSITYPGGG